MIRDFITLFKRNYFFLTGFGAVVLLTTCCLPAFAQVKPPRPISVTKTQDLSFGAFVNYASGGTVIIATDGSRSKTNSITLIGSGYLYFEAIFEIDADPGSLISITNFSSTILPGSNGGSITLDTRTCFPASPFITSAVPPAKTPVHVGGMLHVGAPLAAPAGDYSGTISVTFFLN
jgi:hypothetical protein